MIRNQAKFGSLVPSIKSETTRWIFFGGVGIYDSMPAVSAGVGKAAEKAMEIIASDN